MSIQPAAVELRDVSKRYWKIRERSLLRSLVPFGPPYRTELWALHDANLRVEPGETVGIIGQNGAGKSTMLRLLAGVTRPTRGTVVTRGRVAPLLSVGVGFHQEMTGRENIYVNGMLLGLGRARVKALFDDIVAFAELEEFIDTPVKFYSSGMYMRLGFSVAIHADPDVLLVDEVLAVGDVGFRLRSLDRMRALQASGTALVFVSHWLQAVQVLCPRAVCMHQGALVFDGPSEAAIAKHHELLAMHAGDTEGGAVRVVGRELTYDNGEPLGTVHKDDDLCYRTRLQFARPVESPLLEFRVLSEDGTIAYGMQTTIGSSWRSFAEGEETAIEVRFRAHLGGGSFSISTVVMNRDGSETLGHDHLGPSFFVAPRLGAKGISDLEATITVDGDRRSDHESLRFDSRPRLIEGA